MIVTNIPRETIKYLRKVTNTWKHASEKQKETRQMIIFPEKLRKLEGSRKNIGKK